MEPLIGQNAAPADVIKDSSAATFAQDVLIASQEVPVIVDFWAPWCGPCKTLGPVLEKAVTAAGGKVRLVKVNVDENPQIAQQLRVQSIPAVFAFANGQPVDGFVGALPDSQVKAFVQRLSGDSGPSQVDQALEMAEQALAAGDDARAADIYRQIIRVEPDNPKALAGLAHGAIREGDLDGARELLDGVPAHHQNDADIASARAALELAGQAADAGDLGELRRAVEADSGNHQARFDLAGALVAAGQRQEAVDQLLELVRRDRKWNDEAARKQLVKLFEAFGPTDALTVSGRRRLSSILFS